jgi:hypothetical protein
MPFIRPSGSSSSSSGGKSPKTSSGGKKMANKRVSAPDPAVAAAAQRVIVEHQRQAIAYQKQTAEDNALAFEHAASLLGIDPKVAEALLSAGSTATSDKLDGWDVEGDPVRITRAKFDDNPGKYVVKIGDEYLVATDHGERPYDSRREALAYVEGLKDPSGDAGRKYHAYTANRGRVEISRKVFDANPGKYALVDDDDDYVVLVDGKEVYYGDLDDALRAIGGTNGPTGGTAKAIWDGLKKNRTKKS